ncbi:hypothetical protein ACFQ1I_24005 [Kitasatospora arboriphila]
MSAESPVQWSEQDRLLLEERVAAAELAWLTLDVDVATLRVEIDNFALVHHQLLGPLYARLDELDALIAEAVAVRTGDPEALRRAAEARSRVAEPDDPAAADLAPEPLPPPRSGPTGTPSGSTATSPAAPTPTSPPTRPSRSAARPSSPGSTRRTRRATPPAWRSWLGEWSTAPETAPDPDSPDRPDWLLRRLEWLTARIGQLATEQVRLERTPMGELLLLAPQEPERLLEELAEQLLARASERRADLERLLGDDVVPGPAPTGRHNGGRTPRRPAPVPTPRRIRRCSRKRCPPPTPRPCRPTPHCSTSASRTSGTPATWTARCTSRSAR